MCSIKCLPIVLLVCFLSPIFFKVAILTDYVIQYRYYVEVLCDNKNKPELKCNGKCHLAKQLKKLDEDPVKPEFPQKIQGETEDIYLKEQTSSLRLFIVNNDDNKFSIFYPSFRSNCFKGKIFQPPESMSQINS
jgi:hypothetical protein